MPFRWMSVAALLFLVGACGDDLSPYTLILSSPHFRVHVYPGVAPPPDQAMLDGLEGHYRDTRAFLGFPEGVIDYYLHPSVAITGRRCWLEQATRVAGCAWGASVYSASLLDEHELIHAYMYGVARSPPPILQEAVASGVACSVSTNVLAPVEGDRPEWSTTVTGRPLDTAGYSIYDAGLALFGYLTRTFGPERFVEYYRLSHDTRDPEVFRADFEAFWKLPLQHVWEEMFRTRNLQRRLTPICPCTQPEVVSLDGSLIDFSDPAVRATHPLPSASSGPYLFVAEFDAAVKNCLQDISGPRLASPEANLFQRSAITAARLLPERHYVHGSRGGWVQARVGNYVAATCAEAESVTVPSGFVGTLNVTTPREAGVMTTQPWYTRFVFADVSRMVTTSSRSLAVCSSCAASATECTSLAPDTPFAADGNLIVRAQSSVPTGRVDIPEEVTSTLTVLPP